MERHRAQTIALACGDTTHCRRVMGREGDGGVGGELGGGETSAVVTHPAMPCCSRVHIIPVVYYCSMHMGVLLVKSGNGR